MNNRTRLALTAITAFSMLIPATHAAAQRAPVGGSSSNKAPQEGAKPQGEDAAAEETDGKRKYDVSDGAKKAIFDLQTAVNANDQANIPALLEAAKSKASTPDDRYIIGSNEARAAQAASNLAGEMVGYDMMRESGVAVAVDHSQRYANLGQRLIKAGQNDKAEAALGHAVALDGNNSAALALLADLKTKQGKDAEAVDLMAKSLAVALAKGEKPAESNFMFAAGTAYKARSPKANQIALQWIKAYPSQKSWRDGLRIYRDLGRPEGTQLLDLMRLAHAANALNGEQDFYLYLSKLSAAKRAAEGQAVWALATADADVDLTKTPFVTVKKEMGAAPARAAIDAAAAKAKTGGQAAAMIAAGDDLYGVGAYAEAAELYRAAAAAGGDADLANLRLGMALARAGDKSGALTALGAVNGVNKPIADYWMVWVGPAI